MTNKESGLRVILGRMSLNLPILRAVAMVWLLAAADKPSGHAMMHLFFHLGLVGLLFISMVDSSFVPLPIPGVTDIMIIVYAANRENVVLLVAVATIGSALGGLFSHAVGQTGGKQFLEKRVPPKLLKRVTDWVESHAIWAVALPAILPPPMPLSPFVLAAGAVHMDRKKFMIAFTASRFVRHAIAAWIGIRYGKAFLHLWREFSAKWGTPVLIVFWVVILGFTGVAVWKLVQISREMKIQPGKRLKTAAMRARTRKSAA